MLDHLFQLYMVRVYTNQIIIYKHIYVAINQVNSGAQKKWLLISMLFLIWKAMWTEISQN